VSYKPLPATGSSLSSHAHFSEITELSIAALVDRFYSKACRDPVIGPVFNEAVDNWDEHLAKLRAFWS